MNTTSIKGKVAIITGAATGAGLGIAKAFVKEGVAVVITGRTDSKLQAAKAELKALVPDAQVLTLVADNTDHSAAQTVVDQTIKQFGRLDILVNNAQIFRPFVPVENTSFDDLMALFDSGTFAYWRFMSAALPYLKDTQGTVINMGSGADTMSVPGFAGYAANKAAVRALTRVAAKEWGQFNIKVNVICPYTESEESRRDDQLKPELNSAMLSATPLRRMADAEKEIGSLCVYLSSPEGGYMTGSTFDVDGGTTIRV